MSSKIKAPRAVDGAGKVCYTDIKKLERLEIFMSIKDSVTLVSGKWEAEVSARLGANVTALRYNGKDVLVPLLDEEQLAKNPYIQGSPILLPANRTYLGKFSFEGRDYQLPVNEPRTDSHLHGLVHRQAFEVLALDGQSITMKYSNRGECYPFDFDITAAYTLTDEGLEEKFTIKNTGSGNMPYVFCLHTTFVEPELFTLPISARQENDKKDIPTGRIIPLSEQEERYVTGSPSRGIYVVGYFESAGNAATVGDFSYTVSENFDHWILYNARGEFGYICIEPQHGKVNGLNIEGGCPILAPGEEAVYTTRFQRK